MTSAHKALGIPRATLREARADGVLQAAMSRRASQAMPPVTPVSDERVSPVLARVLARTGPSPGRVEFARVVLLSPAFLDPLPEFATPEGAGHSLDAPGPVNGTLTMGGVEFSTSPRMLFTDVSNALKADGTRGASHVRIGNGDTVLRHLCVEIETFATTGSVLGCATYLRSLPASDEYSAALSTVARTELRRLIDSRSPVAAAVIDEVAFRDVPGAADAMVYAMFCATAHPLAAATAAQRARLPTTLTPNERGLLWLGLRSRIPQWEFDPNTAMYAVRALGSVSAVAGHVGLPFLLRRLATGSGDAAFGAAQGLIDWTFLTSEWPAPLTPRDRETVLDAARARLARLETKTAPPTRFDVRAGLIWLVGCVATGDSMQLVADTLVRAFASPVGATDGAALQGARASLASCGSIARDAFNVALSSVDPSVAMRFRSLIPLSE